MDDTKISIIIPVYNVEPYLRECLESVVSQDYSNFEVLIINDGSTDGSKEICEEYASEYDNCILINKKNEGLAAARNTGIENSTGKYLVFIDSDDYIRDKNFLSTFKTTLINKKPNMICYGWTRKREGKEPKYFNNGLDYINQINPDEVLYELIRRDCFSISAWTHLVERSFIVNNNCYFKPEYKTGEDIEWIFNVLSKHPYICGVNSSSYVYRERENSITTSKKKTEFWRYREKAITAALKYINSSTWNISFKKGYYACVAYMYVILLAEIENEPDNKKRNLAILENKKQLWLLDYAAGKKTLICKGILRIFGYRIGARILGVKVS